MLKRFFGSRRKGDKSNPSKNQEAASVVVAWPTALQRVAAAKRARNNGSIIMPTRSSPARQTIMMFCPIKGKELLQRHEDCRREVGDDDYDDEGSNEERKEEEKEISVSTSSALLLHKPVKPNQLLSHALTNTNGADWRRQRPLVQRALGDASVVKKIAVPAAVKAAVESILSLLRSQRQNSYQDDKATTEMVVAVEVRSFSLQVAVATMIASVFGTIRNKELKHHLEKGIQDLFHPTLLPVRGNAEKAAALDQPVQKVVDELAAPIIMAATTSESSPQHHDPCLALNLLEQEQIIRKKSSSGNTSGKVTPILSRQEVIGNCHSALLAGTQTIATTLAGSMLHLAEFKTTTSNCTSSTSSGKEDHAWFRAVVNETLRILPPVASLPRCPANGDLHIRTSDTSPSCPPSHAGVPAGDSVVADTSAVVTTVPEGGVLLLDVLSMAHCPATNKSANNDESKDGDDNNYNNTWKFCPNNNNNHPRQQDRSMPRPYPWGFGDRMCPAGNLSVSCISAVLEALVLEERWSWQLTNPDADSVGSFGTNGWIENVSYQPTLSYPKPLWLTLSRKQ